MESPNNPLDTSNPIGAALRARDLRYVITGASGWLGRATLDILEAMFGQEISGRVHAFGSYSRKLRMRSGAEIAVEPLDALADLSTQHRYVVLHFAFLTRDKLQSMEPEAFVACNESIRQAVIAAAGRLDLAGLILPSSGAVYADTGKLETDPTANPYGFMKRQDEIAFADVAGRRNFPLTIARVFNLSGPNINKVEKYALGSILRAALHGGPIRLRAAHPVIRSYVDVGDAITVSLSTVADAEREPVVLFETVGEQEIEIGMLARLAARIVAGSDLEIIRPAIADEPVDRYVGEPAAFHALAARYGLTLRHLEEQIGETAAYLRQVKDERTHHR
jgi:nucleoside-diphosphate-sugar epimerase